MSFPPAPIPESRLARYRRLSPAAGVFVSPLQFGGMSLGNVWGMGVDKEHSFELLDAYYQAGGNFIDNANFYHSGLSEEYLGEWMQLRGIRDELVVATKYTGPFRWHEPNVKQATLIGNSHKSMFLSLEKSLQRLRTTYVDILYVHWWDYCTSIEEVVDGLHNLVTQGKVLYLGVSNVPAWIVSEANRYAKDHGKTPFVIYQGAWNVFTRDLERDIIPMARAHGMALAPFNVLDQGKVRTDAEEEQRRKSGTQGRPSYNGQWERTFDQKKVCHALEKVAAELGAKSIRSVALAYVMQKAPDVFPIVGGRTVEQMKANLEALEITLSKEQIAFIEGVVPFDAGYPHNMIGDGTEQSVPLRRTIYYEQPPILQPILPSK